MIKFLNFKQSINYDEDEIRTHAGKPQLISSPIALTTRPPRLEIYSIFYLY